MLTVYQPPKEAEEEEVDTRKLVLPAKRPYLTKVNGRLVMAREKRDKPVIDLLGEAFGLPTTRVVQKRTISASPKEERVPKFLTAPSQQQIAYPPSSYASLATPFAGPTYVMPGASWTNSPSMMQVAQFQQPPAAPPVPPQPIYYQPQLPSPPPAPVKALEPRKATDKELKLLERINADYTKYTADQNKVHCHSPVPDHEITKETTTVVKTTATVVKHICAHCGRLRSAKFHYENPIKPGEEPVPSFCRKCQRDAGSTSGSDIEKNEKPKKKKKGKNNKKGQKKGQSEKEPEEIASEDIVEEPAKEPKKAEPVKAPSPLLKPKTKDGHLRRARSITRIKRIERTPSADYIIVEEQYSDGNGEAQHAEELRPKYLEDSELSRRPLPQLSGRRERSTSKVESMFQSFDRPRRQEYANSESQPRRHEYADPKPPTHRQQTSPLYGPEPLPHRHHLSSQYDPGPAPHSYHRSPSGYYEHSPAPPPSRQTNHIEINVGRRVADVQYQDEGRETYQPYREYRGAYEPTKEQHSYRSHERYEAPRQQRDSRNQEYFEEHFNGECLDERVYEPSTQRRFSQKERLEEQEFIYESPRRRLLQRDTSSQPRSVISAAYQPQSQQRIRPKDLEVLGRSATPVIFEPPVQRHLPVRDESFEERETVSSARSQQSAQRRRRERMRPTSPSPAIKPWEAPHIIHPQENDEAVVVTERFTYKPRRPSGLQEDSSRRDHDMGRESINGAKIYTRQQNPNHEANVDVSKNYLDSWDRSGSPEPFSESQRGHFRHEKRGSVPKSIRDYMSADYIRRAEEYTEHLPRAPTPPSIYAKESLTSHAPDSASSDDDSTAQQLAAARQRLARLTEENQVHRPRGRGYKRFMSDESEAETTTRGKVTRKVKEKTRGRDRERSASVIEGAEAKETRRPRQSLIDNSERRMTHNRGRSMSNHRPPYVRETSEGGTEKEMALIPSPKTRRTGESNPFDDDVSELSESVSSRHVKFKSPLPFSEESIREEDSSSSLYESDIIEVIEDHSPPRGNTSKRKEKKEMIKDSELAYGEDPALGTWDH